MQILDLLKFIIFHSQIFAIARKSQTTQRKYAFEKKVMLDMCSFLLIMPATLLDDPFDKPWAHFPEKSMFLRGKKTHTNRIYLPTV